MYNGALDHLQNNPLEGIETLAHIPVRWSHFAVAQMQIKDV